MRERSVAGLLERWSGLCVLLALCWAAAAVLLRSKTIACIAAGASYCCPSKLQDRKPPWITCKGHTPSSCQQCAAEQQEPHKGQTLKTRHSPERVC
jgi:hypothetical protein